MRVAILPEHLFNLPSVGVDEIAMMAALSLHADRAGSCFPSQGLLARILGKSRPWVCAVIGRLVELGLVVKIHRYRHDGGERSCLYRLVMAPTSMAKPTPSNESSSESSAYHSADRDCPDTDTACQARDSIKIPEELKEETLSARAHDGDGVSKNQEEIKTPDDSSLVVDQNHDGPRASSKEAVIIPTVPSLDWVPTDADLIYAIERFPTADLTAHTEKFINKSRAKNYCYHDLSSAWRSWLVQDESSRTSEVHRFSRSGGKHSAAQTRFDVWASVARQASHEVRHAA